MNLRKHTTDRSLFRRSKRGSYLVEAVMTLPVCILALVALALVIRMVGICETIGYVSASELKNAALSPNIMSTVSLCREIELKVKEECEMVSDFEVKDLDYMYRAGNIDDLISLRSGAGFRVDNPAGIHGKIQFTLKLAARGFTGTRQDAAPLEPSAFTEGGRAVPVLVYPSYGQKFHGKNCSIAERESANGNCGVEMDRQDAVRKGYSACMICGGE